MMANSALTRVAGEPVSIVPPRADCASMIALVSSLSVGRNRSARLITRAISCVCQPSFLNGNSREPNASVIAVGVVVARNTAPRMITSARRHEYSTATMSPPVVIGSGPICASVSPERAKNMFTRPITANTIRNTRTEDSKRSGCSRAAATTHAVRTAPIASCAGLVMTNAVNINVRNVTIFARGSRDATNDGRFLDSSSMDSMPALPAFVEDSVASPTLVSSSSPVPQPSPSPSPLCDPMVMMWSAQCSASSMECVMMSTATP